MTVYTQSTDLVSAGFRYILFAGDSLLVYQGVTLGSTNAEVVQVVATTSAAFIAGTLFGASANGVTAAVAQGTMNITATGAITGINGIGNGAVYLNIGGTLSNDGSITSSGGYGVLINGLGSSVINAGRITGGTGGVFMGLFDSDNQTLTNTGSIIAGTRSVPDARYGHGVQVEGDGIVVFNAGAVIANGTGRAGIHLGGYDPVESASGLHVTNDGVIQSVRGWGIDGIDNLAAGFRLDNSGTISGGLGAIRGTAGTDVVLNAGVIAGNIALGAGTDRYLGGGATRAATVDAGAGTDSVIGGVFDDVLSGGSEGDTLRGSAGDDNLFGGAGNDFLYGGTGDDVMGGGAGNDYYRVLSLADTINEAVGVAGGTTDRVTSSTISLNLALYANVEGASLTGLVALSLTGTAGANNLTGNIAANRITGGAGADVTTGGDGRDVFVFGSAADSGITVATRDTITDFTHGVDDLQMTFMASFIGAGAFTAAGQVRYVAATGILSGSTDGDVAAEWTIKLDTGLTLSASDFVF